MSSRFYVYPSDSFFVFVFAFFQAVLCDLALAKNLVMDKTPKAVEEEFIYLTCKSKKKTKINVPGMNQDWADEEGGLHRLLSLKLLNMYRRAGGARLAPVFTKKINQLKVFFVRVKDGAIEKLKQLTKFIFEDKLATIKLQVRFQDLDSLWFCGFVAGSGHCQFSIQVSTWTEEGTHYRKHMPVDWLKNEICMRVNFPTSQRNVQGAG